MRRENKALSEEIKDLMDQIGEGGRAIHEIDKAKRRLEAEKDEVNFYVVMKKAVKLNQGSELHLNLRNIC